MTSNKILQLTAYTTLAFFLTAVLGLGIAFPGALPGALVAGALTAFAYGLTTTLVSTGVIAVLCGLLNLESPGVILGAAVFVAASLLAFKFLSPLLVGIAVTSAVKASVVALIFTDTITSSLKASLWPSQKQQ